MINLAPSFPFRRARLALALTVLGLVGGLLESAHAQITEFVIFGDSLSDTGNIANRTSDELSISYPSPRFGYTDGRFTNGKDTDPSAKKYTGVWHEQLAQIFLKLPRATASLDGGLDYAFGGAKTIDGATTRAVVQEPLFGNEVDVKIDNMGKQVDDFLSSHTPSSTSLYILWGGSNDLLDDPTSATVTATANNVAALVTRLAQAGARNFLVPNVPPLNLTPSNANKDKTAALAQASLDYRLALSAALDEAQAALDADGMTVSVFRLDVYSLFMDLTANPNAYGITNIDSPAQNSDANPDKYLSWDGLHPTTKGHYLLAAEAYTVLTGEPVVSINSVDSDVPELNGRSLFYLTRTGEDLSTALTIPYASSGNATAGVDFKTFKGVKVLKAGKRSAQIQLKTLDDTSKEGDESVTLTVGAGTGYRVGKPAAATIDIKDDDGK